MKPVAVKFEVGVIATFCWPLTVWVLGETDAPTELYERVTGRTETPVEPTAETVKEVAANAAEGVPEITPVDGLRVRPGGRAGRTWNTMGEPIPVTFGAVVVIEDPAVPELTMVAGLLIALGLEVARVTVELRTPPPDPVPVITNCVATKPTVGVPEITPVAESKVRPAGSAGVTV